MVFAGIKVPDTALVRDAIELSRSSLDSFLFNHVMRSWLFAVVLSEGAEHPPDSELLAVAAVLHDMGLSDRGIPMRQIQLVWDAIALHTTPTLALHKEPEVVMTHSGIAVDVLGAGLDRISR